MFGSICRPWSFFLRLQQMIPIDVLHEQEESEHKDILERETKTILKDSSVVGCQGIRNIRRFITQTGEMSST